MPDEVDLEQSEEGEAASARPFWSGTLSFGLVSIPVNLFAANRKGGVPLRMLGPNGAPLSRRYYSQAAVEKKGEQPLQPEQMTRGYETDSGQIVTVSDEELERLAPENSRDIQLQKFVGQEEIPPIYFERAYFLAPSGPSNRAYRLLAATMEETGRAAIANFVMRGKEYLIALFAEGGILRGETLRFQDEIRTPEDIGLPERAHGKPDEVAAIRKFLEKHHKAKLDEGMLKDTQTEKLLKLVDEKRAHDQTIVHREMEQQQGEVLDILEVLKRSLAETKKEAPAEKAAGKPKKSRKRSAA